MVWFDGTIQLVGAQNIPFPKVQSFLLFDTKSIAH